ncbi:MAG: GNAT family N-acetyltransferase, partial [Alkalibacterium sp.]
ENVYVLFYAVTKKQHSKGYGRQILEALKEYYPHQQIVLDLVEMEEDPSEADRETKKAFYEENGFYETAYDMQYADKRYELLCNKKAFDKSSFSRLLDETKPLIDTIKTDEFEPEILDKTTE